MITESSTTILFYYPVSDLFDKVKMHSGMVARMTPKEIEKYAITDDETTFFHAEMDRNLRVIYGLFHKLSVGITDALVLNSPSTQGGTDHRYGFYVNNNDGLILNSLNVIDGYIQNLLIEHLLKSWWLKVGLAEQYKVSMADVHALSSGLNNTLYSLYKSAPNDIVSFAVSTATINEFPRTISYSQTMSVTYDPETGIETTL